MITDKSRNFTLRKGSTIRVYACKNKLKKIRKMCDLTGVLYSVMCDKESTICSDCQGEDELILKVVDRKMVWKPKGEQCQRKS